MMKGYIICLLILKNVGMSLYKHQEDFSLNWPAKIPQIITAEAAAMIMITMVAMIYV